MTIIRHGFVPDTQVKPDVPLEHLAWAAQYFVDQKVDVIVQAGDFADLESLSSYDVGKKSFEGRRFTNDIEAAKKGMEIFMAPIRAEQERLRRNKEKQWNPRLVLTLGNHENRINRAVENDAKLDGLISVKDLGYEEYGWEVIPFLQVKVIDGIAYSHYFTSGSMGRAITSAKAMLTKQHMSTVAGHLQGRDLAFGKRADGTSMTSIISGSFYQHEENYLTAQDNIHWRGIWVFNDIRNGSFDEMPVSLEYLRRRFDI